MKKMISAKARILFTGFIFCLLSSCRPVTDNSEHTVEFRVINVTDNPITVEFVSDKKEPVFKKTRVENLVSFEKNSSDFELSINSAFLNSESTVQVCTTFIPGTYNVDIDGFCEVERIYPIVYKDGQKVPVKLRNYTEMPYDSNPSNEYFIFQSKLKYAISKEVYSQLMDNTVYNDNFKDALKLIYHSGYRYKDHMYIIINFNKTIKEITEAINLLEQNSLLIDDINGYYIY